jgi:hypothetical protein
MMTGLKAIRKRFPGEIGQLALQDMKYKTASKLCHGFLTIISGIG